METIRTKELSKMISYCIDGKVSEETIGDILKLAGDTIASAASRGHPVHIARFGTFKPNNRGWIRFTPARTLKNRFRRLKEKIT